MLTKKISSNKSSTTPTWWINQLSKQNITESCINELPKSKQLWLKSIGLSQTLEMETAYAWICWKKRIADYKTSKSTSHTNPFLHNNKQIKENVNFHKFVSDFRASTFSCERDGWGSWMENCPKKWKGFITTLVMILTPRSKDASIKEMVSILREKCNVTNPQSILFFLGKSYDNRTHLQDELKKYINTNYDYKKATYCVDLAMVCLIEASFPSSDIELLCLSGVGYKVTHVVLWELYEKACGIPCDIHMCQIFNVLGWVDSKTIKDEPKNYNPIKTSQQMESWFPKNLWGNLNRIYAGLGQLLSEKSTKDKVASSLLKIAQQKSPLYVIMICKIFDEYNVKY